MVCLRSTIRTVALMVLMGTAGDAGAACVCRCVGGQMQPLCSNSLDIPPICPPTICPLTPPSIAPIDTPSIPPIGTSFCRQRQVLDPYSGSYEWRRVCE